MGPGRAMSGIGRRGGGLALLAALWLAGCAQAPKDLYSWETFARQQHEVLRADGVQSAQQIQDMEAHAQKVRGEGAALPPGFLAFLLERFRHALRHWHRLNFGEIGFKSGRFAANLR